MIRAVLFDVDGVLVHPWRFQSLLASEYGISPEMTAPFFRGPFIECLRGRIDVTDVLPPFLRSWKWPGSAADFMAKWLVAENAPDNEVLSVVAAIRESGVPCFVASSQERLRAQYLASEMRFDQLFDGVFFSCDLGYAKPEEGFYQAIRERLGYAGSELLFFDDAIANVAGATASGWVAEHFTGVDQLRRHIAQYVRPAMSPIERQDRKAARLILVDQERRVLLFQYEDQRGKWWATPGGGLEPGESFEDAAAREAGEELGIASPMLERLWDRLTEFELKGILFRQTEQYYLVATDADEVRLDADVRRAHVSEGIEAARWWPLGELRTTSECVFPEDLSARMDQLAAAGRL